MHECGRCGESFGAGGFYKKGDKPQTSWCKRCYREWYHERSGGLVDRACDWCAKGLRVTARRAAEPRVFCSRTCKAKLRSWKRRAAVLASKSSRACRWCGITFSAAMRADAAYCSEACNSAAHNATRKLAKRGAWWDTTPFPEAYVSRASIAVRCGWRCRICGGRVSPTRRHPDPLAPSIDHIVPLARGGTNDPDNLQLAHLRCNLSKGAAT